MCRPLSLSVTRWGCAGASHGSRRQWGCVGASHGRMSGVEWEWECCGVCWSRSCFVGVIKYADHMPIALYRGPNAAMRFISRPKRLRASTRRLGLDIKQSACGRRILLRLQSRIGSSTHHNTPTPIPLHSSHHDFRQPQRITEPFCPTKPHCAGKRTSLQRLRTRVHPPKRSSGLS